ncbi:acyl-CoA dehydrogenase family protein [Saccharopolyspora sp. WRP15-2]|uniref:Acyl-CoA dehydrogenase family protein n=1 Tax=Saccharopolyspora oryzae TaxID=2997343 RepID=A0ABT4USQ4_9PSEU|nr:acyl-CoA dehydrogenase family protein [Saccharopolyspora oryzae]MDA3624730.1 acyl-CoA dehydrogenase family protein [Saccharopolyspora oryzae]
MSPGAGRTALVTASSVVSKVAAAHAAEADAARGPVTTVVDAVVEAGFARHMVPAAHGGAAGGFGELVRAVAEVGRGCASAAWFASLCAAVGRMAAYLPAEGRAEVWADGPDAVLVGGLLPAGTAEPVAGGWRLSGRWPYVSGVAVADWALLCGKTAEETPSAKFFAVPKGTFEIIDTWHTVGMRGTGSHSLALEDVFVPAHRALDTADLMAGTAPDAAAACHSVPLKAANGITLAAPALGAGSAVLTRWSDLLSAKLAKQGQTVISGPVDRTGIDLTFARSAGEIDLAELLLTRVAEVADSGAVPPELVARNQRDCALAVELLSGAVDRLFRSAGSTAQDEGDVLARGWRDVAGIAGHSGLQFTAGATAYARLVLSGG